MMTMKVTRTTAAAFTVELENETSCATSIA
jgi:hypothetical protein